VRENKAKHESMAHFYDSQRKLIAQQCIACGDCLQVCPIFPIISYAAEGPVAIAEKLLATVRDGVYSDQSYEMAFSCSNCFLCKGHCPVGLSPNQLMRSAGQALMSMGKNLPIGLCKRDISDPYSFVNLLSLLQTQGQWPWLTELPANPRPTPVVLYASCLTGYTPNLLLDVIDILKAMKVDFVTIGGTGFCCSPGYVQMGRYEVGERKAKELTEVLAAFKPEIVLTICMGCDNRFRDFLPNFFHVPFRSQYVSDFMSDNIEKIPFNNPINKIVTFHDSCHLGRERGEYESPRKLLRAIPGLKLVEMAHHHEDGLCCGARTFYSYPEHAKKLRQMRLEEARDTGAQVLATACTVCHQILASDEKNFPFETVSIFSLIANSINPIGIDHLDMYKDLFTKTPEQIVAQHRQLLEQEHLDVEEVKRRLSDYFCWYGH